MKEGMTLTEGLGRLGEGRELVRMTRRTTTGLRGPLRLRRRSQPPARGKAGERNQRTVSGLRLVDGDGGTRTSIGWHASPNSTKRPFGWTQVGSCLRSMRRHFSVDLTSARSFWTLQRRDPSYISLL